MVPINLKLENFFSHKDSEICFTGMTSCLLIGNKEGEYSKSNGSGKSAIFEAIPWALFNNSRASSRNDNIKWGQDSCRVELIFEHLDEEYKVERKRVRKSSTSSVCFFRKNSLGEWDDLSGETATVTNRNISDVLGMSYKTFLNTVYFKQNDISEFSEADPSRKKEILKNIVDITRWDDYESKAKEIFKLAKMKQKILLEDLESFSSIEKEHQAVIEEKDVEIQKFSDITKTLEKIKKRHDVIFEEYLTKKASLDTNLYDKTQSKINYISKEINRISLQQESFYSKKEAWSGDINLLHSSIEKQKNLIKSFVVEDFLDKKISDIDEELSEMKVDFKFKKEKFKSLEHNNAKEGVCPSCMQSVSAEYIMRVNYENENNRDLLSQELSSLSKSLTKLSAKRNQLLLNKDESANVKELSIICASNEEKLNDINEKLSSVIKEINKNELNLKQYEEEKQHNFDILKSIKDASFSELKEKLYDCKEKRKKIQEEYSLINKKIGALEEKLNLIILRVEEYKKRKLELVNLQDKIDIYTNLVRFLGKNGVQTILLNNLIEDLESECNTILLKIGLPVSIVIETQVEKSNSQIQETLNIKIRKDGYSHAFDSLSGGEKTKIALFSSG